MILDFLKESDLMIRIYSLLIVFVLIFLPACSKDDSTQDGGDAPSVADIEQDDSSASQSAESTKPAPLSAEDKKRAAEAPDGMVFIKGGCFIMGNNNAQSDEKYEHEVCLDDFYMDKY